MADPEFIDDERQPVPVTVEPYNSQKHQKHGNPPKVIFTTMPPFKQVVCPHPERSTGLIEAGENEGIWNFNDGSLWLTPEVTKWLALGLDEC